MTITILSPYQVFFIDDSERLWTVLKDGRLRSIKSVPAFSALSASRQFICGVSFDGERTQIQQIPFGFGVQNPKILFTVFGYCYYPALCEGKHDKVALLKADLLNASGTADLIVYAKARIKFHPVAQMSARIVPPIWDFYTSYVYYVTAKGALARTNGDQGEILAEQATLFCLNKDGTTLAYYVHDQIVIVSLQTGVTQKFTAFNVTALSFNTSSDQIFFAAVQNTQNGIYTYDRRSGEVSLLVRTPQSVKVLSF